MNCGSGICINDDMTVAHYDRFKLVSSTKHDRLPPLYTQGELKGTS